jgi:hypothetical protein
VTRPRGISPLPLLWEQRDQPCIGDSGTGVPWEPYLVQLPVELCRAEGVGLVEVLPQEEDQAAVVHVESIVMPVHF